MSAVLRAPALAHTRPTPSPLVGVLKILASLRLTVALLAMSIFLVFVGTLAQIDGGIWTIVSRYFRSWYVLVPLQLFWQLGEVFLGFGHQTIPGFIPFPGGWTLGGMLMLNLVAAHAVRFRLAWKRAGVLMLHTGLMILMLGELITGLYQVEARMLIRPNETVGFTENSRTVELAILDDSGVNEDTEYAIPESMLLRNGRIAAVELPVDVEVIEFMKNAALRPLNEKESAPEQFTSRVGARFTIERAAESSGVDASASVDAPATRVVIYRKGTKEVLGKYLTSLYFSPTFTQHLPVYQFPPQTFSLDGKPYKLELRGQREYLPFTLTLNEFRFDRYPGTNIPKNYSSRVTLCDPRSGANREVLIRMNEPLPYEGATYYQAGVTRDERGTILQVTRNPGVWLPYISCTMIVLGMLFHFGLLLNQFLARTVLSLSRKIGPGIIATRLLTLLGMLTIAAGLQVYAAMPPRAPPGSFDYEAFGRLLVQDGGRIKPLDTVARVSLTVINRRQSCTDPAGRTIPPVKWLLEVMSLTAGDMDSDIAKTRLFRLDEPQVVQQLGLEMRPGSWRYSLAELKPKAALLDKEEKRVSGIDERKRSLQDKRIDELGKHIQTFLIINRWLLATIPAPADQPDSPWTTPSAYRSEELEHRAFQAVASALKAQNIDARTLSEEEGFRLVMAEQRKQFQAAPPAARDFVAILDAYKARDAERFNQLVAEFPKHYGEHLAGEVRRANMEVWFNRAAPFFYGMLYYVAAFIFVLGGWLAMLWSPRTAYRLFAAALAIASWTFLVHTVALLWRMYLMDRLLVFVTNLYSSAIFIGWCAAAIGLIVERLRGRGIGLAIASVAGAASLFVAYFIDLGMEGDKLEMMRAVLDTNFWLATHVTTVTFGYAATLVAGLLGVAFIILGVMTPVLDRDLTKTLSGLIYGVVCFATLLSFTGTVLGGIWADYSWGRFWGWDPKENGAMLIVLWNALILHARWGGLVKSRGLAVLAVFGNIVTAWSWFGTNQLGVGLHAYGFTSAAAFALTVFNFVMLGVMLLGLLPELAWFSRQQQVVKSDSTS